MTLNNDGGVPARENKSSPLVPNCGKELNNAQVYGC
jgi:hypothetical protein